MHTLIYSNRAVIHIWILLMQLRDTDFAVSLLSVKCIQLTKNKTTKTLANFCLLHKYMYTSKCYAWYLVCRCNFVMYNACSILWCSQAPAQHECRCLVCFAYTYVVLYYALTTFTPLPDDVIFCKINAYF